VADPDELDSRRAVEHGPYALANEEVVVGYYDAHRRNLEGLPARGHSFRVIVARIAGWTLWVGRLGDQAQLPGAAYRLPPMGGSELSVDALEMRLDGVDRDEELEAISGFDMSVGR
jgi:hypothetical protein